MEWRKDDRVLPEIADIVGEAGAVADLRNKGRGVSSFCSCIDSVRFIDLVGEERDSGIPCSQMSPVDDPPDSQTMKKTAWAMMDTLQTTKPPTARL